MKIGIITIHYGVNFGSALQAFALCKYLTKKGNEVEVINYIPERYKPKYRYFYAHLKGIHRLKMIMKNFLSLLVRLINEYIFYRFSINNIPLSRKFSAMDHNVNNLNKDLYITGSDQVWNSDYNKFVDPVYYLGFTNGKKISYAASFGKDSLAEKEYKEIYQYLHLFQGISVREDTALKILKQCGIEKASHVLDPIFLLNKEEWRNIIKRREKKFKYVLVYAMDGKYEELINIAKNIAAQRNLKTVLVSYGIRRKANVDKFRFFCDPFDFVQLLMEADFVVTNSFHGVAFSINFNKEFLAIKREKYNSRISSILSMFNLTNRMVDSYFDCGQISPINYYTTNKLIENFRNTSKVFLDLYTTDINDETWILSKD